MVHLARSLATLAAVSFATACSPKAYRPPRPVYEPTSLGIDDMKPSGSSAILVVFRPYRYGARAPSALWREGPELLGILRYGGYLVVELEPGLHTLMVEGESGAFIEADLAAGKTYFAKVYARPGWKRARFTIAPIDPNTEEWEKIPSWLATHKRIIVDEPMMRWSARQRRRAEYVWQAKLPDWRQKPDRPVLPAHWGIETGYERYPGALLRP